MGDITELLDRVRAGDPAAMDDVFQRLYPELRRIARARLSRGLRDTLQDTTVLVHECYLKLREAGRLRLDDRLHFLAYSARAMRSIIVDAARANRAQRRGGGAPHETLDTTVRDSVPDAAEEILDVDAALRQLASLDERLSQVVEMRYFGGMKESEIAAALGVSDRTVRRDWEKARLLLADALRG